jgi:hypothetical protein
VQSKVVEYLGRELRARLESGTQEPLSERWVDLIKCLNEKEREQREAQHSTAQQFPPTRA